jgi:hypothetical protein
MESSAWKREQRAAGVTVVCLLRLEKVDFVQNYNLAIEAAIDTFARVESGHVLEEGNAVEVRKDDECSREHRIAL